MTTPLDRHLLGTRSTRSDATPPRRRFGEFARRGSCPSALAAALVTTGPLLAEVIDVPGDFPTITIAIANATSGDELVLAPGTYFETLDLGAKELTVRSADPSDPDVVATTVIDAFGLGSVVRITGGQTRATVFDGLTITGGRAVARGGGFLVDNASPTIRRCRIVDNAAANTDQDGGGIIAENGSVLVEDCFFADNFAEQTGGAIYSRANSNTIVRRTRFEGNLAELGSAVAAFSNANITLEDCEFVGNGDFEFARFGGAIWCGTSGNASVERSFFDGNQVFDAGAGAWIDEGSMTVRNSVLRGNVTVFAGAALATRSGSITAAHCTLLGNEAIVNGSGLRAISGGSIVFRNGVIWAGIGPAPVSGSGISVTRSVVEGGYAGVGNISIDPSLDADGRPLPGSPVIDAADTYVLLGDAPVDFDGHLRAIDDPDTIDTGVPVYSRTADMGAFEFVPEGRGPTCDGDLNGDGTVNGADLSIVLGAWGTCP